MHWHNNLFKIISIFFGFSICQTPCRHLTRNESNFLLSFKFSIISYFVQHQYRSVSLEDIFFFSFVFFLIFAFDSDDKDDIDIFLGCYILKQFFSFQLQGWNHFSAICLLLIHHLCSSSFSVSLCPTIWHVIPHSSGHYQMHSKTQNATTKTCLSRRHHISSHWHSHTAYSHECWRVVCATNNLENLSYFTLHSMMITVPQYNTQHFP